MSYLFIVVSFLYFIFFISLLNAILSLTSVRAKLVTTLFIWLFLSSSKASLLFLKALSSAFLEPYPVINALPNADPQSSSASPDLINDKPAAKYGITLSGWVINES